MAPRAGLAENRKRALIGAALLEISERGSLEVTVAQIARRAGVSPALAHHYFGGKDDLILATMRHLLTRFRVDVVARLKAAGTPRERISAILRASFGPEQFDDSTVNTWLTFYTWALSSPGAARLLSVYHRRLRRNLVHAFRDLTGRAEAERIAGALGAYIDGVYLREVLRSGPPDAGAAVAGLEHYVDMELAQAENQKISGVGAP
ncbi:choline-binding transcriptional repressor BetI [Amaricoccus tamworthensis]|uniref:choline-binding transcriptional repressor BetI n=1 Tax=Amaricoccus tamworthensis TaxID=57002 RepID=UPI003C7C1349